jgi:hypothetical protein
MSEKSYIEDIFLEFYDRCLEIWKLSAADASVLNDFYIKISNSEELTQNQGNYLLRLMSKYKHEAASHGLYFDDELLSPVWKRPFRVLDQTRKVFIEKNEDGQLEICLRFPYSFKNIFEKEMESDVIKKSRWDNEEKLRKIDLYQCNIVYLYEFVKSHNFEMDESFIEAVSYAEEVWNEQEKIIPCSFIETGRVVLSNTLPSVEEFFITHRSNEIQKDIFLAKSMGFLYNSTVDAITDCEKISSSASKEFWFKDLSRFLQLHRVLDGITAILLDRNTENIMGWLEKFVNVCDYQGISRSEIKVCFRESDSKNSKLNNWIKENQVGGEIKNGKILIFLHKPPKWIFKGDINIQLIGLNNYTPLTDPLASSWVSSHHCTCYVTDIRPTENKGNKIVEL